MSIKDFKARVQIIICNSLIIDDAERSADIIEIIIIVHFKWRILIVIKYLAEKYSIKLC